MSRWEDDVAAAVKNAYAERRALPTTANRRRRNPLSQLVFLLWRLWNIVSLWFIIRWLWHVRYVGKAAAIFAAFVWTILALAILAAVFPQTPQSASIPLSVSNASSHLPHEAVKINNGAARLGDWEVTLTRYSTVPGHVASADGRQFQWLVVHWKLHNPTQNAIRTNRLDFSATSFGVNKLGEDPAFIGLRTYRPLTNHYLTPGQTASGDVVFEVFRTARTVKFLFEPSEGNPNFEREVWTIRR